MISSRERASDVAREAFVAGGQRGRVAQGVLVQGADAAAAVQQVLVAAEGGLVDGRVELHVAAVRLDGEEFRGAGHRLADGPADALHAAVPGDEGGFPLRRFAGAQQRGQGLRQAFLTPPFLGDAVLGGAQQPVQGEVRCDRLQPAGVVPGGVEQAEAEQERGLPVPRGGHVALVQGAGVTVQCLRPQRVRRLVWCVAAHA